MAIKSISEIKQKFAPLARPTALDFGDMLDTVLATTLVNKIITPEDVLPIPPANLRYQGTAAGIYDKLKLQSGAAAPPITVTATDLRYNNVYFDYSKTNDAWSVNKVAIAASTWSRIYTYEQYGEKTLKKLESYYGGNGDAPTEFIGLYLKSDGGFTDDKSAAGDFTAEPGRLEYDDDFDI